MEPISFFGQSGINKLAVAESFRYEWKRKQEAQLVLTNPRDAFRGQSRSPNIVSFHMLGKLSSRAIVTLSLRRVVFLIIDVKKCRDLEIRVKVTQGH